MGSIIDFPHNVNSGVTMSALESSVAAFLQSFEEAKDQVRGLGPVDLTERFDLLDAALLKVKLIAKAEVLKAVIPSEDRVVVDGVEYQRMKKVSPGRYFVMEGEVVVHRALFRAADVRNGPTLDPIAARCGLVGGCYAPRAAQAAAFLSQSVPSREAATICKLMGVLPFSRSSVFRLGQQVGELFGAHQDEVEQELVENFEIPEEAATVSIAVDRVSIAMAEDRDPTANDRNRGVKRPISVNYRMAFCGVWTLHDSEGRPLHSVRYAHVPEDGSHAIEAQLACDLDVLMECRPDLKIVPLADGARDMQKLLDRIVSPRDVAARFVDYWHLIEKLGAAIKQVKPLSTGLLSTWKATLLQRDDAIRSIHSTLTEWALEHEGDELPTCLHEALTYTYNNNERMCYASARAACLPIASGHAEATCKCIVTTRFKRAGARWKPEGAQALLDLRALATSSRWTPAMQGLFSRLPRAMEAA